MTETHNKKTIEPLITDIYMSKIASDTEKEGFESYTLKNCGVGPAILTSIVYKNFDGHIISNLVAFHKNRCREISARTCSSYFILDTIHILSPNESLELFKVYFDTKYGNYSFSCINNGIEIEILYETLYKEQKNFKKSKICSVPLEEDHNIDLTRSIF